MNLKPKINFSFLKSKSFIKTAVTLGLLGAAVSAVAAIDPSTQDVFKGQSVAISNTFGSGSTFEYAIYVAEVILGVAGYMKTRNLMALVGLAVVIIFTAVGFGVISPSS